jgi:hypothetical protein
MLDLNPEIICFIISKAHEFHAKEQVVFPEEPTGPGDTSVLQILADHADDPSYQELKNTIEDLEPDQQVQLVALMWAGRGDYDVEDWESALNDAGDRWTTRTADYLIATPLVADYLEEGLSLLGYSCEG